MLHFEVRKESEKKGETAPVWSYRAKSVEHAAQFHIRRIYGRVINKYPDFWSVISIEPVGTASRIDRRQLYEAKLRTNRPGKINAWEVDRFFVRPLASDEIEVEKSADNAEGAAKPPQPAAPKS